MNIPLLKWNSLNSTFSVYILNEMCVCVCVCLFQNHTPFLSSLRCLIVLVFPLPDATILGMEGVVFHAVTNYPQSSWLKTHVQARCLGGE